MTPAINLCHGLSVIGGVVDTGEKFITGINDTTEQWFPMTMTPVINFLPVATTPVDSYRRWQRHWRQHFSSVSIDTGQKYPKSLKFIAGVNNTAEKLFTGVNDTADKFFAYVNATANKTELTIPACQDLKMKNKQKFDLQE
jgi:hypothetical protein